MNDLIEVWWKQQIEPLHAQIPGAISQLENVLVNGGEIQQMRQEVLNLYNVLRDIQRQLVNGTDMGALTKELELQIADMKKQAVVDAMKKLVVELAGDSVSLGDIDFSIPLPVTISTGTPNTAPAPVVAPSPAPTASGDLPWIDSAGCTSCDDCVTLNKNIFGYDGNKKATIINPKGGPFRDIVKAAEKCPAEIIHPGDPLDPKEKDLAKWIKRAEKYQ